MMKKYFMGHEVSEYGVQNGRVDYRCLANCFDAVLNNDILQNTAEIGCWDIVNGSEYDEKTDEYAEIFQLYIVSESGAEIIQKYTDDVLYYNEKLNMYVWGISHYGTSWDYVLTDIELNK